MGSWQRRLGLMAAAGLLFAAAACGGDDDDSAGTTGSTGTTGTTAGSESPSATTGGGGEAPAEGAGITLAVNPWTGSAVNANVAKIVLESEGTPVELVEIDENATWPGMASGDIDAVLEV